MPAQPGARPPEIREPPQRGNRPLRHGAEPYATDQRPPRCTSRLRLPSPFADCAGLEQCQSGGPADDGPADGEGRGRPRRGRVRPICLRTERSQLLRPTHRTRPRYGRAPARRCAAARHNGDRATTELSARTEVDQRLRDSPSCDSTNQTIAVIDSLAGGLLIAIDGTHGPRFRLSRQPLDLATFGARGTRRSRQVARGRVTASLRPGCHPDRGRHTDLSVAPHISMPPVRHTSDPALQTPTRPRSATEIRATDRGKCYDGRNPRIEKPGHEFVRRQLNTPEDASEAPRGTAVVVPMTATAAHPIHAPTYRACTHRRTVGGQLRDARQRVLDGESSPS